MLIRRTPGVKTHLDTATSPPAPPSWLFWHCPPQIFTLIITLGLILYCPKDYCSNVVIRSLPILCLLGKCDQNISLPCQNVFAQWLLTFLKSDWLAQTHHVRQSMVNVIFCDKIWHWLYPFLRGAYFVPGPWHDTGAVLQQLTMERGCVQASTNTYRNCFSTGHFLLSGRLAAAVVVTGMHWPEQTANNWPEPAGASEQADPRAKPIPRVLVLTTHPHCVCVDGLDAGGYKGLPTGTIDIRDFFNSIQEALRFVSKKKLI